MEYGQLIHIGGDRVGSLLCKSHSQSTKTTEILQNLEHVWKKSLFLNIWRHLIN